MNEASTRVHTTNDRDHTAESLEQVYSLKVYTN